MKLNLGAILLRGVDRPLKIKAALLSSWFFVTVATLWLLKPLRVASLLAHLGATETPYVRLAGVATLAIVVMLYTALVGRLSRIKTVRVANFAFALLLLVFWGALQIGGERLGAQRPFVWAVYIMVEIYSVVLIGIFWTYCNDVVNADEANKLYGVIGLGGILGGAAGGAFVDAFAGALGPLNLMLVCVGLVLSAALLASITERVLHPAPRRLAVREGGMASALKGAMEVRKSRYLLLIVAIVVAYEFTATLTDFGVNVIFERAYPSEIELAEMYGRLGWIASATAVVGQILVVPLLLPARRIALLVPPFAMLVGVLGVIALPLVVSAFVLGAADRGLNYSLQQVTKESLYVPLSDTQKYQAKAFIDMFIDRAAKALAAFVLIAVIFAAGPSARVASAIALVSVVIWIVSARWLGAYTKPDVVESQTSVAVPIATDSPVTMSSSTSNRPASVGR